MQQGPAVRKHWEPTCNAHGPLCATCSLKTSGAFACVGQTLEEVSEMVEHLLCLRKIESKSQSACLRDLREIL